jgi:hypothetical protein
MVINPEEGPCCSPVPLVSMRAVTMEVSVSRYLGSGHGFIL